MQAQTIISDVRLELVETIGAFWQDTELLRLINKGEMDFVRRTRILEYKASVGTTQGDNAIPLPANWISARAVFFNNPASDGTPNWLPLRPTNLEKQKQEQPNFMSAATTQQGKPARYWVWGRTLMLDKIPDITASGNIVLFYKGKPIPLTVATQDLNVDDSLADGIAAYVRWKAWKKEKEPDLAQEAKEEYFEFVGQGRAWVKRQTGDQAYKIDIQSPVPITYPTIFNPFLE